MLKRTQSIENDIVELRQMARHISDPKTTEVVEGILAGIEELAAAEDEQGRSYVHAKTALINQAKTILVYNEHPTPDLVRSALSFLGLAK